MFRRRRTYSHEVAPEDIFLDAHNVSDLDTERFEGRLEQALSLQVFWGIILVFSVVVLVFLGRLWVLQGVEGEVYRSQSETNRLARSVLFSQRGVIEDRNGVVLVSNESQEGTDFARRVYATTTGLAHVLGYVRYPQKDANGFYIETTIAGEEGVEDAYDAVLSGENGSRIIETTARGEVVSSSTINKAQNGDALQLTIDSRIQNQVYESMKALAEDVGFEGGSSVILDVDTGEVLSLVSYPEYDVQQMADRDDPEAIQEMLRDERQPFLNRATAGLYTPGSVIKPFVALGALVEDIISPNKEIFSSGRLVVPNRFNPDTPTIFHDWKAHGNVDIRRALAVSSNVYFFHIGGGFEEQEGIKIAGIEKYARLFGISEETGIDVGMEQEGVIPNPRWKEEHFPGDPWRVGDTYNTSIGQYGFQVTPLQMARAVAGIASGGVIPTPHVAQHAVSAPAQHTDLPEEAFHIVQEGMRQAVTEGTAQALSLPDVAIAAKTGTAELGSSKAQVNSWIVGFFPYEEPQYAFATVMERGPATNLVGSAFVMRQVFDWMREYTPEYFK